MDDVKLDQYELLKRLSFVRFGGTDGELRAAELLLEELERLGGKGERMDFQVPAYDIDACSMTVTAPFTRQVECVAHGHSGELPPGGVELPLRYVEVNAPAGFYGQEDLTGCAVLINALDWDMYHELVKRHAAAIIAIDRSKWYHTPETTDLVSLAMRPAFLEVGRVPTFTIRARDAIELVRDGAERVLLELRQTESTHTSRNVLATVEGTEITDECMVITAHYDSVTVGTGAWDNGTGAVTLMYLYAHFLRHPPRRTLRFIWCGSEEQGLLGSKAYVEQHPDVVAQTRFCVNFDMNGTYIGHNSLFITGADEVKHLAESLCNEAGCPFSSEVTVHSSDSAPFADKGVPAVGLSRGHWPSGEIHTRNDQLFIISPKKLRENGDFAVFFVSRLANAAVFPVKREMPENMVKELEKYFRRDKLALLAKEREGLAAGENGAAQS